MTRRPFVPPATEAERVELARLHGRDAENVPLSSTAAERQAARDPGLPSPSTKGGRAMEEKPFIGPQLTMIAVAVGTLFTGGGIYLSGSSLVPGWIPITLWAVGAFALWLAGKQAPAFKVLGPAVPVWLVPGLGALAVILAGYAAGMGPGRVQSALLLVASLLTYLSGKTAPPDTELGPVKR